MVTKEMEKFVEKFMQYLYDNYLPMPEEINWTKEFAVYHDFDEKTGRPCDFCLNLSINCVDDIVDAAMRKAFRDMGLKEKYEDVVNLDWIFGLLHELAHIATLPQMTQEELTISKILIDILDLGKVSDKNATTQDYFDACLAYWNTPVEHAANEWVVNILNIFPNIVYDIEGLVFECYSEK